MKTEMRVTPSTCRYSPRYRPILAGLLIFLCIPIFFYHLVPAVTTATDKVIYSLSSQVFGQTSRGEFCTTEVGDAYCCQLYLDATPCVDECRKQHVDRETLSLTLEYDQCADKCMVIYSDVCEQAETGNPLEGSRRNP